MILLKAARLRMRSLVVSFLVALACLLAGIHGNAQGNDLFDAADKGDLTRVQTLLSGGINVDARSKYGYTPLYAASQNGHLEVVQALLEKGADVNAMIPGVNGNYATTALIAASDAGKKEIADLLLAKGADPNDRVAGRQTALGAACRNGHLEIVKSLLAKGANVNETETSNESALSAAAERGDVEIVKLLLVKGADPNIKDGYLPPLIQASMGGFPEIVQMLLDKGAEVNAVDDTGRTALIWATQYAFVYQQSTMSLLGQGSPTLTEVTMDYKKGRRGKGQFVYEQIMLGQAGPFKSVDPVEANERRRKVVVALLAKGADLNARSKDGCTPLMTANELNHAEIAALLVNAGARP